MIFVHQNILSKLFIVFLGISMLLSCATVNRPVERLNEFSEELTNRYYNDSLGFSVEFFGNALFGKDNSSLHKVRKKLRSNGIKVSKGLVLWGEYKYVDIPMYLIGYVETNPDLHNYAADSSDHGYLYYYRFSVNKNSFSTDVMIPLKNNSFFHIVDVELSRKLDVKDALTDAENSIKEVFRTLNKESVTSSKHVDIFEIADSAFKVGKGGNYLLPLKVPTFMDSTTFIKDQVIKSYLSFIGEEVHYLNQEFREPQKKIDITVDSLVNLIKDERVIMFNENHLSPSCRLLVSLVLDKLSHHGFNVLALEALGDDEKRINHLGFPIIESGFYTREPNMANLIRIARSRKFKIISYEDFKNTKNRDLSQARNIVRKSRIRKVDTTKIIVLAGGGHIDENKIENSSSQNMGYYFKKITKIDPLTINQVKYLPKDSKKNGLEIVEDENTSNDIFLVNSLETNNVFLGTNLEYSELNLNLTGWNNSNNLGFYLYKESEYLLDSEAIPIYVRFLPTSLSLKVPKGAYIYIIKDINGIVVYEKKMIL